MDAETKAMFISFQNTLRVTTMCIAQAARVDHAELASLLLAFADRQPPPLDATAAHLLRDLALGLDKTCGGLRD